MSLPPIEAVRVSRQAARVAKGADASQPAGSSDRQRASRWVVADQLQTAMQSRAAIEQAKGILMGQRRCHADAAFNILIKMSQDSNKKRREVAQALIDHSTSSTTDE
jgi:hypothetical protein